MVILMEMLYKAAKVRRLFTQYLIARHLPAASPCDAHRSLETNSL